MRTTLTIDPDVWEQLEQRRRRAGSSLKDEVNHLLRAGLLEIERRPRVGRKPFRTRPANTGRCTLDNLDDVEAVLDYAEGAWRP